MIDVKKLVTISLIVLYCFAMTRVSVNFHYCCNELVSFSINKELKCGHEKPLKEGLHQKSCCSDLKVTIMSDQHVPNASASFSKNIPKLFPIPSSMIETDIFLKSNKSFDMVSRAGPDKCIVPKLFLLNSSFLYYG